jgi:hypothetical protein
MNESGTIAFTSAGRATTDNITFTKSYSDNITGESLTFENASGDSIESFINITNIIPITTLSYTPVGPTLTTGSVNATVGFNKP